MNQLELAIISLLISTGLYLIAPDILNKNETACFLVATTYVIYLTIKAITNRISETKAKRNSLSLTANRPESNNRSEKPVDVKVTGRNNWKIIIPAEKVS